MGFRPTRIRVREARGNESQSMQRRPPVNNVPIELLRAIVAIVDLGSFTKAAQALNLTQPAISAQMKRLQQLVGAEVFSKSGSGLVPTARGELVVKYARRILAMNAAELYHLV